MRLILSDVNQPVYNGCKQKAGIAGSHTTREEMYTYIPGYNQWRMWRVKDDGPRISIVPLNSEPGLNPKPVVGRGLCNLGQWRQYLLWAII